ncbi:Slp family lipoprotein [Paraglaciecola aquimarina]|uniref:Slp family lipoprotein n=1 Tax=Paraglaciecola aquimarina TaxID=1235557 RepID=A0ABU3SX82_9ALTE|nr:Slp family lipoprotein [Paraglaciecola aquimarina]MDU0354603.1 Slp family lipoprotein [Paraglaciecola aquimarina]
MFIRVSVFFATLFLAGCAAFPDKLKIEDPKSLVSYEDAASKADQVKGRMIRWGGAIAKIENKEKTTVLEMVYYPLTNYGRPIVSDESMGRFRIHVNGFMDPVVYKEGRLMTFTGQLNGLENGLVGEHKYVFPSVNVKEYYIWKKLQRVDISGVHMWPYDYWYDRYPFPYQRRVIFRSSNSGNRPSKISTLPKPVTNTRQVK